MQAPRDSISLFTHNTYGGNVPTDIEAPWSATAAATVERAFYLRTHNFRRCLSAGLANFCLNSCQRDFNHTPYTHNTNIYLFLLLCVRFFSSQYNQKVKTCSLNFCIITHTFGDLLAFFKYQKGIKTSCCFVSLLFIPTRADYIFVNFITSHRRGRARVDPIDCLNITCAPLQVWANTKCRACSIFPSRFPSFGGSIQIST